MHRQKIQPYIVGQQATIGRNPFEQPNQKSKISLLRKFKTNEENYRNTKKIGREELFLLSP